MPYAANGGVSSDPLPDSIQITTEQYREAIAGMCDGLTVSIKDGALSLVSSAAPEELPPTDDELRVAALARRDQLLAVAALRIAPLQDAADLGAPTETEAEALVAWKQYRVDLNRIEQQDGYPVAIAWPSIPGGSA
ncbi:tail fiber assembly protein [Pseudomonas soli]|uniref:tail fiber assembly protein n=1 Tax=Pseudomonas soli TaxID=1306993 RepID=UPI003DA9B1C7